jgi:hypothetical protein
LRSHDVRFGRLAVGLAPRKELAKPTCGSYLGPVTNSDRIREAARSVVTWAYAGLSYDGLRLLCGGRRGERLVCPAFWTHLCEAFLVCVRERRQTPRCAWPNVFRRLGLLRDIGASHAPRDWLRSRARLWFDFDDVPSADLRQPEDGGWGRWKRFPASTTEPRDRRIGCASPISNNPQHQRCAR